MTKERENFLKKREPQEEAIDLMEIAFLLLRHWWGILLCLLIGMGIGWGYSTYRVTPVYTTNSLIYINSSRMTLGSTTFSVSDFNNSVALANRYTVAVSSRRVLEKAIAEHDLQHSFGQLRGMVRVNAVNDTEFLTVSATSPDPVDAANVCNAVTESLIEVMNTLVEENNALILDKAEIPTTSSGTGVRGNMLKGGLAFAVAYCGVLTLLFLLDNTIKSQDDLLRRYKYPILSVVPDHNTVSGSRYGYGKRSKSKHRKFGKDYVYASLQELSFAGQEAYKLLRTNLDYSFPVETGERVGRVIGVTSSLPNEYKSTTVVNLALSLAEAQKRVLLLDCDLRKSELSERLQYHGKKGLSEYLVENVSLNELIQTNVLHENLAVMFSGAYPPNPSELISSGRMSELVKHLTKYFDYIVVDLPPIAEVSDSLVAGRFCNGILMTIRERYTQKKELDQSFRELEFAGLRILGVVLTGDTEGTTHHKYSYYREGYGYGYGYGYKARNKSK